VTSSRGLPLDSLEVLDGAGTAQVEEVLPNASVAGAPSLPAATELLASTGAYENTFPAGPSPDAIVFDGAKERVP
jgi:hypothetical protein